ncbi:hypothetical protein PAXINDRAFT_101220 [Paxillus involutus ATCC 200175]|uniref:Uncharacterized protein n=1 Tax=Paxillus involutus ATCC 200175 TaxID=664439 RepID=A0A0C9STX8_PAXIN|nr:hypothetical protein PAXINDRAFT_101220 [Paxillus involutus ATCC 200175]
MARIIAPLATSKAQPARCRPTIASHTRNASDTLSASSNATPPASASPAKLYEVASGVLPNNIAESAQFTSSPRAFDTITHALVTVPTVIGNSAASPTAQSNNDYPSSGPLPSNNHMAILVGIGSAGAIAVVLMLVLMFLFYHRGRRIRSHCHVNPNLKKRHLSVSPVPPTYSSEQGKMIITPFPHSGSGIIIEPGGPVDAEICELEWRVSHRFGEDQRSEDGVCDSVSDSHSHQVSFHTRPTTPMTATPPVLHWSVQMTPEWSAMVLEEISVQASSRRPHSERCRSCIADARGY